MKYNKKMDLFLADFKINISWLVSERFQFNSILYHKFLQTLDKSPRETSVPSEILHPEVVPGLGCILEDIQPT